MRSRRAAVNAFSARNYGSARNSILWTSLVLAAFCFFPFFALGQQQPPNPAPLINWLAPPSTPPGGPGLTIEVYGVGFVPNSIVRWNGSDRATTFLNSNEVLATISSPDTATAGAESLTVFSPSPGGGVSNTAFFSVTNPTQTVVLEPTDYVVGGYPVCGVTADFNGDGKLDLAIGKINSNTVSVLLGNGDGTFGPKQDYLTGTDIRAIVVGDFNGDGKLDLAVANYYSNSVSILLGNGDGTFAPKMDSPVDIGPRSLAAGDFNGDGILDLAVVNNKSKTVSILLGNGDGTFAPEMDLTTDVGPFSIVAADFNQDGKLDLAVSNYGTNSVSIFLGKGDGTFGPRRRFLVGEQPLSLVTADFNGDGIADLAAANEGDKTVSILLGIGDGTFSPQTTFSSGVADTVGTADFNGDAKYDLAVLDGAILLGNGDGTFGPRSPAFGVAGRKVFAAAGDFNGDGRLDILTADDNQDTIYVFLQVPRLAALPKTLKFEPQALHSTSKPMKVVMKNTGSALLQFDETSVTGDFSRTNSCGPTLPAASECTFEVTFIPTAVGTRTGALTITDNVAGSPQVVSLIGTGK